MHTLQKQVRSPSTRVVANIIVVVKQVTWKTLYPRQTKTRYFIVASLTFGVRAATNATNQTSFNV